MLHSETLSQKKNLFFFGFNVFMHRYEERRQTDTRMTAEYTSLGTGFSRGNLVLQSPLKEDLEQVNR